MVRLASCNHGEDGLLGWEGKNKAGDQTGSEVSLVPYNTWSPSVWTGVYRAKDQEVAWRIAQAGIQMARNNHIGYDQSQRLTFIQELRKTGNIDKITVDVETDCSAGTNACIIVAGYSDWNESVRTAQYDDFMTRYGKFDCFYDDYHLRTDTYLRAGDILLKQGHVVICVDDGDLAGKWNQNPLYVLRCTKALTMVYADDGKKAVLSAHPLLGKGNLVDYCDETDDMVYVRIIDKYGWVRKDAMERRDPVEVFRIGDYVNFTGGNIYGSAAATVGIKAPPYLGEIKDIRDGSAHPYYVFSPRYDGWCDKGYIKRMEDGEA